MSRGKAYTMAEVNEIKGFLKDRCTYAEIAELMGRDKKSISNIVQRMKLKKQILESGEDTAPKPVNEFISVAHPKASENGPVLAKEKTLKDFAVRDIIRYLYGLGYRIEDNKLICYVKQTVKLGDIING